MSTCNLVCCTSASLKDTDDVSCGLNDLLCDDVSFNMDVFTSGGDIGAESVEDVVTDMVSSNIMAIFEMISMFGIVG